MSRIIITVNRLASRKPINHSPPFFNLAVSTNPGTSCKAISVLIGPTVSGLIDPSLSVSTIIVPEALWDQILNLTCPYTLIIDYSLNDDGKYTVTGVAYDTGAPSFLASVAGDLETIRQDSKEISAKVAILTDLVSDAEAIRKAALHQEHGHAPHDNVKRFDSMVVPAKDAPAAKQVK